MATDRSDIGRRQSLRQVLTSASCVEKIFILACTAVLSGLVIPIIFKTVDTARERRAAVSNAQVKLFEDVTATILTSETLMLDISWFGTVDAKNAEMQKKAFNRYNERIADLIAKWRIEASRAQTLASPRVYHNLNEFQMRFFREQDTPMNRQWIKCGTDCNWQELHMKNESMLNEANTLVATLAEDFDLVRSD